MKNAKGTAERIASKNAIEVRNIYENLLRNDRLRRFAKFVREEARDEAPKVQWWLSKMSGESMYWKTVWQPGQLIWTPEIMREQASWVIDYARDCTDCLPDIGFEEAA